MPRRISDQKIVEAFRAGHTIEAIMFFWSLKRETVDLALRAAIPKNGGG